MKTAYLSIRIDEPLKKQLRIRAHANRRSMVGEVLYLIGVGLSADMTRERLHGGVCQ